ncbi:hypothetical protein DMH08_09660 [Actinomadura sp. WAC 06369]|nr:hypothetical protein DMH08_09660 [Actinomadura sp. WAC 06369]
MPHELRDHRGAHRVGRPVPVPPDGLRDLRGRAAARQHRLDDALAPGDQPRGGLRRAGVGLGLANGGAAAPGVHGPQPLVRQGQEVLVGRDLEPIVHVPSP